MSRRADNFAGDRVTKIYADVAAKVDSLEVRSLFGREDFPGIYLAREAAAPPTRLFCRRVIKPYSRIYTVNVDVGLNWPYLHLLINHFPIILTVVGSATLALALVTNRRGIWLYALASLTLAGLAIYPVYFTGDHAADALRKTWYVVRSMVREHDESAGWALGAVLPMGAAAAYAWWRMLRREVTGLPPRWLRIVVAVLAVFGLAIVIRTAYLGGKIVHDSPKLETPPAGTADTAHSGQTSTMVVGPRAMGVAPLPSSP